MMVLLIQEQKFLKIRWWVDNMNIEKMSYEELKAFANELMRENEKLKSKVDTYSVDMTVEDMEAQYKDYYSQY